MPLLCWRAQIAVRDPGVRPRSSGRVEHVRKTQGEAVRHGKRQSYKRRRPEEKNPRRSQGRSSLLWARHRAQLGRNPAIYGTQSVCFGLALPPLRPSQVLTQKTPGHKSWISRGRSDDVPPQHLRPCAFCAFSFLDPFPRLKKSGNLACKAGQKLSSSPRFALELSACARTPCSLAPPVTPV